MSCSKRLIILSIFCTILLSGCNRTSRPKVKKIRLTTDQKRKSQLLRKIDKKFTEPEAHFQLGQLYHKDGLWSKAEYEYNTALGLNPVHRQAQAGMVKVLIDSGNVTKSQTYADIYMNQASSFAESSLLLGLSFQHELLDDYALACYQQALNLAPSSANIHKQIGYYYLAKNDKVRAQEYLRRSFQLNPRQPEVAGELGRLGVQIKVPKKQKKNTKRLDKIAEKAEKQGKL